MTTRVSYEVIPREGPYPRLAFRPADTLECLAFDLHPQSALADSVQGSIVSFLISVNDVPVAALGYSGALNGPIGRVWLLTDNEADRYPVHFARASKRMVEFLHTIYPILEVFVDSRHTEARMWLRWLGFTDYCPVQSPAGFPFWLMRRER